MALAGCAVTPSGGARRGSNPPVSSRDGSLVVSDVHADMFANCLHKHSNSYCSIWEMEPTGSFSLLSCLGS